LCCVFILAHEFSLRLIDEDISKELIDKNLHDMRDDFSKGKFKKPFHALENVIHLK